MRVIFALITVFLILCVVFTRWYLCDISGLCDFAGDQFVVDKTVRILEILLMLLVAFLIGFGVAWMLREKSLRFFSGRLKTVAGEKAELKSGLLKLETENYSARLKTGELKSEITRLTNLKIQSETTSMAAVNRMMSLQEEVAATGRRYDSLKKESDSVREAAARLKNELDEERLRNAMVERETKPSSEPQPEKNTQPPPLQSRFTPTSWQTRDDLTKISGIGPVIQRKLNELQIYTFKQISEFTPDMIVKVTTTIKFFPDRIGRDNWIGQAAALMRQRR